jgi:hypothetical protein
MAVIQHEASYPHLDASVQLSSFNLSFKALDKLLEYDIESKLRSNLLSHEEINSLIQESEKESKKYDCEIERLETQKGTLWSVIVTLKDGKQKLDTLTMKFRASLSPCPIRKLPAELLSEIFKLVSPLTYPCPCEVDAERSPRIKPLIFAHTCSFWRSIAFGTPSLWSGIQITLSCIRNDDHPNMISSERALAFVLERSQSHPIFLIIDRNDGNLHGYDDQPLPRAMECLIRESWRWHSVGLWMCDASSAFNFWGLTLDLPNLSSFTLKVHDSGKAESPPCLVAFRNAPMLRKFVLEGIISERIRVLLPWHQLETIDCTCSLDYSPASLISSCISLKSARFVYTPSHVLTARRTSSRPNVIHEPLTASIDTLVLDCQPSLGACCSSFERCLGQLQLNSLRSLDISSRFSASFLRYFESFINIVSQYKSLTSLRLYNVAFSNKDAYAPNSEDESTLKLLKNLTSLESLEIVERYSEGAKLEEDNILRDPFVQALAISSGIGDDGQQVAPILPVLQHLTLEAQGMYLSDKALVGLVCSRRRPFASDANVNMPVKRDSVTTLSSVRFVLTKRRCDAEVFQPLVDMAAAGLTVTVIDSFRQII